jgi:hypothetical protein
MIDASRAKEILSRMNMDDFSMNALYLSSYGHAGFLDVKNGEARATLEGQFTADELEAIACWMRDPTAVIGT